AALVRLQAADEVPFQRQVGQRVHLGQRLLHVVLAEGALAETGQAADGGGRLPLRHRQQPRLSAAARGGGGDAAEQGLECVFGRVHGIPVAAAAAGGGRREWRYPRAGFIRAVARAAILAGSAVDGAGEGEGLAWTSPNCWRFRSRTRLRTCTCPRACRP